MPGLLRRIAPLALPFAVVLSLISVAPAFAEDPNMELTVSPTSQRLSVDRGKTVSGTVTILNSGKTSYQVKAYSAPYSVKGLDYTPNFTDTQPPRADAYGWVTIENPTFRMAPRETTQVNYTITAPKNATPGAHHTVLFFETQPPKQTTGIIRKHRAGVIVYVNVIGASVTKGSVNDISIPHLQTTAPMIATSTVTNAGTTDFVANTQFTIRNIFGKRMYHAEQSHYVMAKTSRTIAMQWDTSPWVGVYKATMSVTTLGKTTYKNALVFVIPVWLSIVIVVVALLLISGGIWRATRRRTTANSSK